MSNDASDLMDGYRKAWEAWFACYLYLEGKAVQELGLAWSGNGGENQLKRAFIKWYDTCQLTFRSP